MKTYLPGLTGIRGFGACAVFAFHATDVHSKPLVLAGGYLGVDLFFLLSGFVLAHAYRDQVRWTASELQHFARHRMVRIFPLHLATLAAVVAVVVAWPGFADSFGQREQRFGLLSLAASVLLIQNWAYFLPGAWNTPTWSLSAEWGGYLVLPLLLLVVRRVPTRLALIACYAALVVFLGAMAVKQVESLDLMGTPGMVRMLCEISAGCLLHRSWQGGVRANDPLSLAAVVACFFGTLPPLNSLAILAMPIIILAAADEVTLIGRFMSSRPMLFLGEVSFSIYLTHWLIIQSANRLVPVPVDSLLAAVRIASIGAVVLGVSFVTYRLIEKPSRRLARAGATPKPLV